MKREKREWLSLQYENKCGILLIVDKVFSVAMPIAGVTFWGGDYFVDD